MRVKTYDVGIGWASPVDAAFVSFLKKELKKKNISVDEITYQNITARFEAVAKGEIIYRCFVDRSSFDYPAYAQLAWALAARGTRVLNNPVDVVRWGSKLALYKAFRKARIPVAQTHVLLSLPQAKKEAGGIIKKFSAPFAIKPAYGGMEGDVLLTGWRREDILAFMEDNGNDAALVQEFITPAVLAGRVGWFRPLYVCGTVIPLRWNPQNKFYEELTNSIEEKKAAAVISHLIKKIYAIIHFDIFSIEVAYTEKGNYIVTDYANHPIDLQMRENSPDALPQNTLSTVAASVVRDIVKP